jgi:hypothetical protein
VEELVFWVLGVALRAVRGLVSEYVAWQERIEKTLLN